MCFSFFPASLCNIYFICLCIYAFIYHASSKINLPEEQLKAECNPAMSSHSVFQGEMENPTMTVVAQLHNLNPTAALNDSIVKFK